jgi:hypothetical protein
VSSQILDALAQTAARRFQSFAEAVTSVLDLLHAGAPAERIALAQLEWDEAAGRVIDARGGDDSLRTAVLPLAVADPEQLEGGASAMLFAPDALAAAGLGGASAAPLDGSDGAILGVLLATGTGDHVLALPLAARLLSYEWQAAWTQAELRRLGELTTPLRAELERAHARLERLDEADRRAEQVRLTLAEMRAESERQAELNAHAERELRARLTSAEGELETMARRFDDLADAVDGVRRQER